VSSKPRAPQPAVYARLNAEAEVKLVRRRPPAAARWLGWALIAVMIVVVVLAAVGVGPW
jgi:hypothetical protein